MQAIVRGELHHAAEGDDLVPPADILKLATLRLVTDSETCSYLALHKAFQNGFWNLKPSFIRRQIDAFPNALLNRVSTAAIIVSVLFQRGIQ